MPGQLLVGDGAVTVGAVDDLVDLLAVEVSSFGTAVGFEVVDDPGGGRVWFGAKGTGDAVGSMGGSVEVLRRLSVSG